MRRSHDRLGAMLLAAATAAVLAALPTAAGAQTAVQSAVPKEPCCFNNFRFAGTCQVTPRQGQLCQNILNYLNSFNSAGETYCDATVIRGGWTLVDCQSGDPTSAPGFTDKQFIESTGEPQPLDVATPSGPVGVSPRRRAPQAVDPRELTLSTANVIQVRLEEPLEGDKLDAGQLLSGRLERDLVGPDGSVVAPAGSAVSATVGAGQSWQASATGSARLQLVGTTTSAADLFGTAGAEAPPATTEPSSVHLAGELVELSPDSVLTFQLRELSDQPADLRVLTTATEVWMSAFNARDPVTLAGLWSDDGAMLPPDDQALFGRDEIYAYWTERLREATVELELANVETVVEGDLGYKAGRYRLVDPTTGEMVDQGKYMQIWKRSPAGFWELHRDMWNRSGPG